MKKTTFLIRITTTVLLLFTAHASNATALTWATYFGGSGNDNGQSVATDASGNIYVTGQTTSASGIATTGAYQTTLGGGSDAFIAKFTSTGTLLWATYYGGSGNDGGASLALDGSGNVYIVGTTTSISGIATSGAYQTVYGGGGGTYGDAFLAKFSSTGTLLSATYFGGSGDEHMNSGSIKIDGAGNAYIYGWTNSTSGIATTGAYQATFGGGVDDAFIAKFNGTSSLLWATYFGGSGIDEGRGIIIDASANIFVCGSTSSTSSITTPGAYRTTISTGGLSGNDAFLAKFTSVGTLLWATYYGGSDGEGAYGAATDGAGNVYITGETHSDTGIATAGAYQTVIGIGIGNDAFLAKFSGTGGLLWATYYGGTGNDHGSHIVINSVGDVYIGGNTTSTAAIASPGAYQTVFGGGTSSVGDGFLVKFNSSGARLWGTYYGGSSDDGISSLTTDGSSNVYFAGSTKSTSAIATSGSYQPVFGGGVANDAFLGVFNDPSTSVAPITGTATVCVGLTTTLSDATPGGTWSSASTTIATVGSSSGIVTGVATGTANIIYTVGASSASIVVTVNGCTTKVKHGHKTSPPDVANELSIYPNPNHGTFTLNLLSDEDELLQVIITNVLGQKVKEFTMSSNAATDIKLNVAPGIYFVAAHVETQDLASPPQVYFTKVEVE